MNKELKTDTRLLKTAVMPRFFVRMWLNYQIRSLENTIKNDVTYLILKINQIFNCYVNNYVYIYRK